MNLGPLRTLALTVNLSAHGVAAVVTRPAPDHAPITTSVIWLRPMDETQSYGTDINRVQPRRVMVIPKADVPELPRGSRIVAAEFNGVAALTWLFDGHEQSAQPDHWMAIVKQVSA